MKNFTIFLFIMLGVKLGFSQNSITGKISDCQSIALPYANVILYEVTDNSSPQGTISDDNGNFRFENINPGSYRIEVSMLGFETKKITEFFLNQNKTLVITLQEENQTLDEVVVTASRPVIRQTAEKLTVDLEKTELLNSNLQDIMRKVPGVLVTDSGISIAGKGGVLILINGKTTAYMDVETLLRDFPADNIAKIEVVEQPGSEYDATGSGAIVNIILKKNMRLGTHGSVMGWVGKDDGFEYGTSASIASYKNKLNWQTSISHSKPTWREDLFIDRVVETETYNQKSISPYNPNNLTMSGTIDYYINENNSIGIGGRWNKRSSNRITTSTTVISNINTMNTLLSENTFDRDRADFNINPYYEYQSESQKIVIDFNYINYRNNNTNMLSDIPGSTLPFVDRKYAQDGTYTIKTYKMDYSNAFSEDFTIHAGSKYAIVDTNNDLQSFLDSNANGFELDNTSSSQFLINERIFALYSKINTTLGEWSFSGGLRYETSNTDGTSNFVKNGIPTTEVKKRPIKKIFPSASMSRNITENIAANLSYSYRISRPSYNSLNSFQEFIDPFSAEEGNPNLTPAFTNNYQFNLTFQGQPFFTVGYSNTADVLFNLIKQDNSTAQIRQQTVNVEDFTNWNFRLFAPLSRIKNLKGYTGFIVNKNTYTSALHGVDLSKWSMFWFIQTNYKLPWDVNFELNGNYGTGALDGQIEVDWLAGLDFSFGKRFLEDKLKVNLGFNKMLNRGFNGSINYGNGTAQVESNGSRQNIQLRLVYNFGSKFGKKKSNRNTSEEEENRIDSNN